MLFSFTGADAVEFRQCRERYAVQNLLMHNWRKITDPVVIGRARGRGIQALKIPAPPSVANDAASISRTLVQT